MGGEGGGGGGERGGGGGFAPCGGRFVLLLRGSAAAVRHAYMNTVNRPMAATNHATPDL